MFFGFRPEGNKEMENVNQFVDEKILQIIEE